MNNNNFLKNINNLFIFIIVSISLNYYFINIRSNLKKFISFVESNISFKKNDLFFKFCVNIGNEKIKELGKKHIPKISIICPVYNRHRYLLRFLKGIQFQTFNDLEILFVDDNSLDNSSKLIEQCIQKDKRISLIKNKKNKGTFINRNLGGLYSKGTYIILPDPDDILSKNNLKILHYSHTYPSNKIRLF